MPQSSYIVKPLRKLIYVASLVLYFCISDWADAASLCGVNIVRSIPHRADSFTEGLLFDEGRLYESTGLNGSSSIKIINPYNGAVIKSVNINKTYFGEGIVSHKGQIFYLTWTSEIGFVFDKYTLEPQGKFLYKGQGWGITGDDNVFYVSDGTSNLRLIDPKSFETLKLIEVTYDGKPVDQLNELEWVGGFIYANIWRSNWIIKISPENGEVVAWVDATRLFLDSAPHGKESVLNGIAYDSESRLFYITGKNWPKIYAVEFDCDNA